MSRNKENKPLPSQSRANGSVFGAGKPAALSDFFTDSILDDTTSKIPSPSPRKNAVASKPRRAFPMGRGLTTSRSSINTAPRSDPPDDTRSQPGRSSQPAPTLSRPLEPRSSQQELITPPQSRDGPSLKSPISDVSSPPTDLAESYQRIEDEQQLAEAERASSDEDDWSIDDEDEEKIFPKDRMSPNRHRTSRDSTPKNHINRLPDANKENLRDDQTAALSEASGMSFLNSLTDQKLAERLTPGFKSLSADRKRIHKGISQGPIMFKPLQKPSEVFTRDEPSPPTSHSDPADDSPKAFRLASKERLTSIARAHSDPSLQSQPKRKAFSQARKLVEYEPKAQLDENETDSGEETPDELRGLENKFIAGQAKKTLARSVASHHSYSDNDLTQSSQQDNETSHTDPTSSKMQLRNQVPATEKGLLSMWRRKAAEKRAQRTQETSRTSSPVDWAEVDADVALPTTEGDENPDSGARSAMTEDADSVQTRNTAEKMHRLDDFTGGSFQVSQSPMIKHQKSVDDFVREAELTKLSKSAVATNRLDAIRQKDPREAHRRLSPRTSINSRSSPGHAENDQPERKRSSPDTPAPARLANAGDESELATNGEWPTSFSALQRLVRLSTTPKSSPKSASNGIASEGVDSATALKERATDSTSPPRLPISSASTQGAQFGRPLETPKPSGAWLDTVLPDTARPAKLPASDGNKYTETPFVKAGGWVDTPLTSQDRQLAAAAPVKLDLVVEEVDDDIEEHQTATAEIPSTDALPKSNMPGKLPDSSNQVPRSALTNIINQQRQRHSGDGEMTLDLGDNTIASLEGLLDDTENDLTLLINQNALQHMQLEDDLSESQAVDRLTSKLHTMQSNLQHVRKGIGKLEHQMTVTPSNDLITFQSSTETVYWGMFPVDYWVIKLPILRLFHPRQSHPKHLPFLRYFGRPTLLGYIVLTSWTWFFFECLLAEFYAHPRYATHYAWPTRPEPRFGVVLPTMTLRALGLDTNFGGLLAAIAHILDPILLAFRALYRVLGMSIGWTDGFVDDVRVGMPELGKLATATMKSVVESMVPRGGWGGDAGSMMDDEVL